jgi:type I restriction enzyme, R subunit
MELIKQIEVNIDYILMLLEKYKDSLFKDKEVLEQSKKQSVHPLNLEVRKNSLKVLLKELMRIKMLMSLGKNLLSKSILKT